MKKVGEKGLPKDDGKARSAGFAFTSVFSLLSLPKDDGLADIFSLFAIIRSRKG